MVGDAVGAAITAIEPDDEDTLSYEIDNDATTGITIPEDHDANFFSIDKDSGQIRVANEVWMPMTVGDGRTTMAEKGKYVVLREGHGSLRRRRSNRGDHNGQAGQRSPEGDGSR